MSKINYLLDFDPRITSFVKAQITNHSGDMQEYIMSSVSLMVYSGKNNIKKIKVTEKFESGDTKSFNRFKKEHRDS
jgi:hypothetical protein